MRIFIFQFVNVFQEFKWLMSQSEGLRTKIENAVRINQLHHCKTKNDINIEHQAQSHTPTIKLKTDFSNFS